MYVQIQICCYRHIPVKSILNLLSSKQSPFVLVLSFSCLLLSEYCPCPVSCCLSIVLILILLSQSCPVVLFPSPVVLVLSPCGGDGNPCWEILCHFLSSIEQPGGPAVRVSRANCDICTTKQTDKSKWSENS